MIYYCKKIANAPIEVLDGADLIRSVEVSTEWTEFREQLANDMFADYQARLGYS